MCRRDLLYQKYCELREQGKDVVFHFRNATRGDVNLQNCHPHYVKPGLIFVHNGTIKMNNFDKDEAENSDTKEFRDRLADIFQDGFEENDDAMDMIGDFIDHSKLLFLRADGEHFIVNKSKGKSCNGNWFSNYQIRGYKQRRRNYAGRSGYTSGTTKHYRKEDEETDEEEDKKGKSTNDEDKNEKENEGDKEEVTQPKSGNKEHTYHPPKAYFYHGYTVCEYCLPECVDTSHLDEATGGSAGTVYCDNCDHLISPDVSDQYSSTGSVRG